MLKTKIITLKDGGNELKFKIRQMTATDMEDWIMRFVQIAASADMGDSSGGIESFVETVKDHLGKFIAGVDYAKFKPLWDELLKCCSKMDDRVEQQCDVDNVNGYISNFMTLINLRVEALKLNFDFFTEEKTSESPKHGAVIQAKGK